jgi:diacylglycerol kinase (ATP)
MALPSAREGVDAILIFGGDGTVHHHLGPLVKLGLPVLVVPSGSANDFAGALGLRGAQDSLAAWRKFATGESAARTVDLGLITEVPPENPQSEEAPKSHYFSCAAGVGLDGEISRRANALPRWLRRHGGYALSLPPALLAYRAFRLKLKVEPSGASSTISKESDQTVFAAVFANTPVYGGGMRVAPRARLDDGQLDVCLINDISKLKLLGVFPAVYFGRHLGIREVEYYSAERVRVDTTHPMDVYADGEYVCRTPINVSVARGALQVIAPAALE